MTKKKNIGELNRPWARGFKVCVIIIPLLIPFLLGTAGTVLINKNNVDHLTERITTQETTINNLDSKIDDILISLSSIETILQQDSGKE